MPCTCCHCQEKEKSGRPETPIAIARESGKEQVTPLSFRQTTHDQDGYQWNTGDYNPQTKRYEKYHRYAKSMGG